MLILICSQYGEGQVAEVCQVLIKKGVRPLIFERYRRDHQFTFKNFDSGMQGKIKIEGKEYPLNSQTFKSIWFRTKPVISSEIPGEESDPTHKFCFYEWQNVLQTLEYFLPESICINPVYKSREASKKIYQLKIAKEVGLDTPDTVITNNFESVLDLFEKGEVIYKTLAAFFSKTQAVYTNVVTERSIRNSATQIAMAPGIYQNLIAKSYELRCTVVGEEVFVVRINSQKHEKSSLDWRRFPSQDIYELAKLSEATQQKLIKFHRRMGLVYAAYDFIVDKDGREVFLECNPNGQWLWLEDKLQLGISEAIANILMGEKY